ncbi:MAG: hypothetical protein WCT10_05265 [Patescibacteria group bacterium]
MFKKTERVRLEEAKAAELSRLRWKLYLFTILLVGSGVSILALAFGGDPEFVYRATFFGLLLAAVVAVGIPHGDLLPAPLYALLGSLCLAAVAWLSDRFHDPSALAIIAGAAMLIMSGLAWMIVNDLGLSRFTAILGCLALAGAVAALIGFSSLYFSVPFAIFTIVGIATHIAEIRRVVRSA